MTRAPSSDSSRARFRPTLPKPWIATRVSGKRLALLLERGADAVEDAARGGAVAARPTRRWTSGFPVTTPSTEWPTFIEYVSKIHAITCALVPTSGAGMSFSGPISLMISVV